MFVPGMSLREAMNAEPVCSGAGDSVREAAVQMRDRAVDSLPVCDEDGRLMAVLTARDIVVHGVAEGHDPSSTLLGSLLTGTLLARMLVAVDVGTSPEDALARMIEHAVRRLPVTEDGRLVGMVSQVVLAALVPPATVRRMVAGRRWPALDPGSDG